MIKINYRWIKIDLKKLLINLGETQKICPTLTKKKEEFIFVYMVERWIIKIK
jgi:hypothetical protein